LTRWCRVATRVYDSRDGLHLRDATSPPIWWTQTLSDFRAIFGHRLSRPTGGLSPP
jgi:hypothetical protein